MTLKPRLVVFDVDGTLVDSQTEIVAAMRASFAAVGHPVPARDKLLSIVGLSLEAAMQQLAPDLNLEDQIAMVAAYKAAYHKRRVAKGSKITSPLYPGARNALDLLRSEPETLLGIATGKSKRGLDALLKAHDLQDHFFTCQVADFHPSKPNPAMLEAAMHACGVKPDRAVMVGDTRFDMEMSKAAGVCFIGVGWGYHPPTSLAAADHLISDFSELQQVLRAHWEA